MEKKAEGLVSGGREWDRKDGQGPGLRRERMDKKAEGLVSGGKEWERRPGSTSPSSPLVGR